MTLFGYGKTTQAIAEKFGNCTIFDDKFKEISKDKFGNTLMPSHFFNPEKSTLEITSPGLPPANPLIQKANNLISEYDIFADSMPYSIWISGTNGKTTTTAMLQHILKRYGSVEGGNIGNPLAKLNEKAPIWILETSSFALHYTNIAKPNLYILLPVSPDHISWHGSYEEYEKAKLKPLDFMKEGEAAIIPKVYADYPTNAFKIVYESSDDLADYFGIDLKKINFKDPFLTDALLAIAVEKILFDTIDYNQINSYKIDKHRLEEFYDKKNKLWVNDSKATNVDATIAALKRYKDKKIFIILGGDDKGADLTPLFQELKKPDIIIFAIGTNAEKLNQLAKQYGIPCSLCHTLTFAINEIIQHPTFKIQHCAALLSPAASSLDQFPSYADRGEIFIKTVLDLS